MSMPKKQKLKSKREKEISRVINSTTTMYGDLQGIVDSKLERVERLQWEGSFEGLDGHLKTIF